MKKIDHSQRAVWVGMHPKLGALVYDELCQQRLRSGQVRLFKLEERAASTFLKDIVRTQLVEPTRADWERIEPQVDRYLLMVLKPRSTHCYRCKLPLDSVDFTQCPECQWLRCECGACGCEYRRRVDVDVDVDEL